MNARGTWGNQIESILAYIGYVVGFGNFWRFPYLCYRNGGAAFLIPYAFFTLFVGIPLFYLESYIGQFSSGSPVLAWKICPLFSGIGWALVLISFLSSTYYAVILCWDLYYLFSSMRVTLPWTVCSNWWNSQSCKDSSSMLNFNTSMENYTYPQYEYIPTVSPSVEFFHNKVLQISEGIDSLDGINWELFGCLASVWLIIFFGVMLGAKTIGKVVCVTVPLSFLLLFIIGVRVLILPGSFEGMKFYIYPSLSKLMDVQVWMDALFQVFYSIGFGFGGITTLASYNNFKQDCFRDSFVITFVNSATSFIGGFIIFGIYGFLAMHEGVSISDVATSGPGFLFLALPKAFAALPAAQIWCIMVYLMFFCIGISTMLAVVETSISGILDFIPALRKTVLRVIVAAIVCFVSFLCGIIYTTRAGMYYFILIDWMMALYAPMLIALLEVLLVSWIYGLSQVSRDIKMMFGMDLTLIDMAMKILWGALTPIFLLLGLFQTVLKSFLGEAAIYYQFYRYPSWANKIGWFLATLPMIPIVIVFITYYVINLQKKDVVDAFFYAMKPPKKWGPANDQDRENYQYKGNMNYLCPKESKVSLGKLRFGTQMQTFVSDKKAEV